MPQEKRKADDEMREGAERGMKATPPTEKMYTCQICGRFFPHHHPWRFLPIRVDPVSGWIDWGRVLFSLPWVLPGIAWVWPILS